MSAEDFQDSLYTERHEEARAEVAREDAIIAAEQGVLDAAKTYGAAVRDEFAHPLAIIAPAQVLDAAIEALLDAEADQ